MLALAAVLAAVALPAPVPCTTCWRPPLRTSWQWELSVVPKPPFLDVDMYDIDGFDTPASTVAALHQTRPGRRVTCYLSAGSWEDWRPDAGEFPRSVLGRPLSGWPGERYLDIRRYHGELGRLMDARLDLCAAKGFDAVELDNVDAYTNRSGFPLTGDDQLAYNAWLANEAHRRGLSAALKNDNAQIPQLLPYFDWALNEQCFQYDECGPYTQFTAAGKAVFGVEYRLPVSEFCPQANALDFNFLKKRLSLRAWRLSCR
jgi:hypothetical protein